MEGTEALELKRSVMIYLRSFESSQSRLTGDEYLKPIVTVRLNEFEIYCLQTRVCEEQRRRD